MIFSWGIQQRFHIQTNFLITAFPIKAFAVFRCNTEAATAEETTANPVLELGTLRMTWCEDAVTFWAFFLFRRILVNQPCIGQEAHQWQ